MFIGVVGVVGAVAIVKRYDDYSDYYSQYSDANLVMEIQSAERRLKQYKDEVSQIKEQLNKEYVATYQSFKNEHDLQGFISASDQSCGLRVDSEKYANRLKQRLEEKLNKEIDADMKRLKEIDDVIMKINRMQYFNKTNNV